jgi:Gylcosyl hydrolase family 115 C-terminal domain
MSFNRGRTTFDFTASASQPWIVLSATHGTIGSDERLWVSVDWRSAPKGSSSGTVTLAGSGAGSVDVKVRTFNPEQPAKASLQGFVEADGYVSIEAAHYTHKTDTASARWSEIADYGRTLSSMTTFPMTAPSVDPPDAPCLQYQMYLFNPGPVQVETILAPTLNFAPGRGLRYTIAFVELPAVERRRNRAEVAGPLVETGLQRPSPSSRRLRSDKLADRNGRLLDGMMNAKDQLHPTVKAYQIWADALKPILTELLGPPAAVDHAPPPTGDPAAAH